MKTDKCMRSQQKAPPCPTHNAEQDGASFITPLQIVYEVVQVAAEVLFHLQRVHDGHVENLALPHADDLIGDAVAQQTNREVACLKGEGAVLGNRQRAALGVADNRRTLPPCRTSAS